MKQIVNADPHGKIVLQGHDPVAFHTAGEATKGDMAFATEWNGHRYLFSSEANKAAFEADAQKYLPAYGGFCAYGIANDVLFPVDIDTWEIIEGRLVLQFSRKVKQRFDEDRGENLRRADAGWSRLDD